MSTSRIRLLGGFSVCHAGGPVDLPVSTERLVAYLALHGVCRRGLVAGALWPDVPEDHALASLRTSLWRLNRSVRALVTPHGPSLRLSPSAGLDTREQELVATRLLREHRDDVEWLERQLPRLWPRDLLPGWYDDWVVVERERLNQLRLHALEHAAALLTAHHRLDSALDVALEAVRTEPLRETANEQLIRVHLARGNVYDAVRQYQLYRGILHRDLGVAPSPHLARLVSSRCARGVVPRQRSADVGVTSR